MAERPVWKSGEVLAWTGHDGPGSPPPSAHRGLWLGIAGVLGIVFATMFFADTLCPEHRAAIKTLGAVAFFGTGLSVVGLVRGWAAAPVITMLATIPGIAIGVIDAAHDPAQGQLIALAFAIALTGASFLFVRQTMLRRWELNALHHGDEQLHDEIVEPVGGADASVAPVAPAVPVTR